MRFSLSAMVSSLSRISFLCPCHRNRNDSQPLRSALTSITDMDVRVSLTLIVHQSQLLFVFAWLYLAPQHNIFGHSENIRMSMMMMMIMILLLLQNISGDFT